MSRDRLRDEYESNQDALGVTEERQEFFDDANSVLGIGYSATMEAGRSKRILREIDERDDEAAKALKKKLEVDPGAGETVNRGAADDYAALRNAGYDHETAMAMTANNEYEVQGDHSEYEPDGDRVTPSMLQRDNRVHGGGGGKSKSPRKPAKPIVGKCHNCEANLTADLAVCQGCGSEVVRFNKTGRPRKGNDLRVRVSTRVEPTTAEAFRESHQIMGAWLDICARLVAMGVRIEDIGGTTS